MFLEAIAQWQKKLKENIFTVEKLILSSPFEDSF
jgi:hypothetical protein